MGKTSREKGADFERQVARWLRENGFLTAMRTAQHSGKAGDAADVVGLPGIHIECKAVESPHVWAWIHQAERDSSGTGNIPVVIWKQNRKQWLALMRLDAFLQFRKFASVRQNDVAFQVHEGKNMKLDRWMEEALWRTPDGMVPGVLFAHQDYGKLVALFADDFLRLYRNRKDGEEDV